MAVSAQYVKEVLATLPTGYYLGAKCDVVFDEKADTSFCNPMEGTIHVALQNIVDALKGADDPADIELFTRCALYHELSHLILSPVKDSYARYENIFEDERCETILAKYFMGVNFKRFIFAVTDWSPDKQPQNAEDFFFFICRYRQGPEELLAKLKVLIRRWWDLTAQSKPYGYWSDVYDFWKECERYWNKNQKNQNQQQNQQNNQQQNQQNQQGQGQGQGQSGDENQKNQENQSNGQNEKKEGQSGDNEGKEGQKDEGGKSNGKEGQNESKEQGKGSSGKGQKGEKDENESQDGQGGSGEQTKGESNNETRGGGDSDSELSDEAGSNDKRSSGRKASDEAADKALKDSEELNTPEFNRESAGRIIKDIMDQYKDTKLMQAIHAIIVRSCKRKANHTPYSNGYAGKIDVRSVAFRGDYRWFTRKGNDGEGKYDRVHLTLWVDNSGSFSANMPAINGLLATLNELVKLMPNDFSFDVITMNTSNIYHDRFKAITCGGCNRFGPNIAELAKKYANKAGWTNYNVVVWDGNLNSASWAGPEECCSQYKAAWDVFNNNKTVIVADSYNEGFCKRGCPKARAEFIRDNYASEFIGKVITLLDRML